MLGNLRRLFMVLLCLPSIVLAQDDTIKLDVTVIKGNTELPKFLYIVPWKSGEEAEVGEQKLVLHGLYMGVLDPVVPELIATDDQENTY